MSEPSPPSGSNTAASELLTPEELGRRFAVHARGLVRFMRSIAPKLTLEERFRQTATLLAGLYAAGLALPGEPRPEGTASARHVLLAPGQWSADEARAYYRTPDAVRGDTVERGDLEEDLEDIDGELTRGLAFFDEGTADGEARARWHWRHTFYSHWGHHAVEALRALHYRLGGTAG